MNKNESDLVEIIQCNSRGKELVTKVTKEVAENQALPLANEPEPQILIFGRLMDVIHGKVQ